MKPHLTFIAVSAVAALLGTAAADTSTATAPDSVPPSPTFTRDVLPILQDHCQQCHRPNQIAPMSFTSYAEVRPWAKAIRKSVKRKEMPPFAATGPIGRYRDDPRLTDGEIATIVRWVNQGALHGHPAHAPAPKTWDDSSWPLGEPDLLLEYPVVEMGARDDDEYVVVHNDHVFEEDLWVKAVDFLPTEFKSVHHAGIFAVHADDPIPDSGVELDADQESKFLIQRQHLRTWLPGARVQLLPEGHAVKLAKGDRIVVQLHFSPGDEPVTDQTRVGLYFADGLINRKKNDILSFMPEIEIPPADPHYESRERYHFGADSRVFGFEVHMHLRGKSSKILFHYPDGRTETALHIPHWDFDWQRYYYLTEPMEVPKGTEVEFTAVWDNSPANPLNPDPTQTVTWGPNTTDEMYGGIVSFEEIRQRKNPFRVENGRRIGRH